MGKTTKLNVRMGLHCCRSLAIHGVAGLKEVETKLADGRTVKAALAESQGQSNGSILLIHEWWRPV